MLQLLSSINLTLDVIFVSAEVFKLLLVTLTLHLVFNLLLMKVVLVDSCIVFNFNLLAELALSDLSRALLIKLSMKDACLQLVKLIRGSEDHLGFASSALISDLKLSHFTSERFLHAGHVDATLRVENCVLKS